VPINEPVETPVDSVVELSLRVTNTGHRLGTDVVQLYLHDPIAQVTRPTVQLIGYARVTVAAGESRRVTFRIPTDVFGFTGRDGHRIVEPGEIELRLSESSNCPRFSVPVRLVGVVRRLGPDRALVTTVQVSEPVAAAGRHHGEGLAE
jgi:beta-xylosidase